MPQTLLAATLLALALPTFAQQPLTAGAIMAQVAVNQDKSETARAHYLYTQHAHIASRKGKTIHCEETTDTRITPTPTGSNQQLLKLDGRLLQKGKYVTYTQLPEPEKPKPKPATNPNPDDSKPASPAPKADDDVNITVDNNDAMDRDLVENLRKNLTATRSKDGINPNLFPLTSRQQAEYTFTLVGREPRNGRDSYHLTFTPKDHEDYTWKGDAWIDTTAFQPIVVRTTMSRKIPLAVRMLLGTNVPGLGFTIVYAPQPVIQPAPQPAIQPVSQQAVQSTGQPTPQPSDPAALWFPTSFGTEFKIHVLFFFTREIIFNAENRDFQQTHTTAEIHDAPTPSTF